jgi:hypothetical protein
VLKALAFFLAFGLLSVHSGGISAEPVDLAGTSLAKHTDPAFAYRVSPDELRHNQGFGASRLLGARR